MLAGTWPTRSGTSEYALIFDRQRARRVLVIPALFDEANKLRHFTVELMRRLDAAGVDNVLPDLPGTGESLASLAEQTLEGWQADVRHACAHFAATHVLAIRGGCLLDPGHLPGLRYAPVAGTSLLRGLLRGQLLAEKEAGKAITLEQLTGAARTQGAVLAGYPFGAEMVRGLAEATAPASAAIALPQGEIGGGGLWLRAEPAFDAAQADALAARVLELVQ